MEPSSQVLTHELRAVAAMALRDVPYDIGAFITLVDGSLFESWWQERRALLLGQVADADLVAVSQADTLPPEELAAVRQTLRPHGAEPLPLSVPGGLGLDAVLAAVV